MPYLRVYFNCVCNSIGILFVFVVCLFLWVFFMEGADQVTVTVSYFIRFIFNDVTDNYWKLRRRLGKDFCQKMPFYCGLFKVAGMWSRTILCCLLSSRTHRENKLERRPALILFSFYDAACALTKGYILRGMCSL